MLNYDIQSGQVDADFVEQIEIDEPHFNPFPGLRPFGVDESHLYFGREGQVDEILLKLAKNRFVALMGHSGSGKSSLIHSGLIPVLFGGFITETGPYWQIISARPGSSPIDSLAESTIKLLISERRISHEDAQVHRVIIQSILRGGSNGLIELAKYLKSRHDENIFFLIDQFEEVFRFRQRSAENKEEATAFINLILTATRQKTYPIFVAIAMRSDFIGECSVFPRLTHAINTSNFLIPQMTREQKRMAIEGPVAVGGGRISQRLVKQLLQDIGDNQDQLPILQHAMMRTWDYWVENREEGEPIDIRHYNAIGKIHQALSIHANEAFEELSTREKEIAEILFKSATEKNQQNQWLRRPVRLGTIAQIADASEQDVINVVDRFRQPGRSLIMPAAGVPLNAESVIEISHESLMRIWTRLKGWVEEEYESAQMYKRISEAAAMYQYGKTNLWRPPDLQLALNWQKKQRPSRAWAQRYDEAFERAIVFLDTSRITYEAELKNQEMAQRRMLRRARVTSIVLGIAALIVSLFFVYALMQSIRADSARQLAETEAERAKVSAEEADEARKEAVEALQLAERRGKLLQESYEQLENERIKLANTNLQLGRALTEAERERLNAELQTAVAIRQSKIADSARMVANAALTEQQRQFMLSIAKTIAVQSLRIEDKELMGNLAMMSYKINTEYGGKVYDPEIYTALYNAQAVLQGARYNTIQAHRNAVRSVVLNSGSQKFYSTGSDGRILVGDVQTKSIERLLDRNTRPNRVLGISKDDRYLVVGSDSSFIQLYDLSESNPKHQSITGHKGRVNAIAFNETGFYSTSSDKTLRFSVPGGQSRSFVNVPYEIKSLSIAKDGSSLLGATIEGFIIKIDIETKAVNVIELDKNPGPITAIAVHPDKRTVIIGTERGNVKVLDMQSESLIAELPGHKSGVSSVAFSPDGKLLASASKDGRMQMWRTNAYNELPVIMDDLYKNRNTAFIWDMKFSHDSNFLIAGAEDGAVRIWPTNPKVMAENLCDQLSRNMTPEEWENYVGNGVDYMATCIKLLIHDF